MRDLVQAAVAALDEVLEAARRGHDDLGAAAQRVGLAADRHAADDGGQAQADGASAYGVSASVTCWASSAGRHQDQGERRVGLGAAARGAGEQGEAEGEGLAGAGAATAEDVAAGERVGQRGGLDRERLGHALPRQRGEQRRGHVQVGERVDGGQRRGDGDRQGELALRRRGRGAAGAAGVGAAGARTVGNTDGQ